MNSGRLYPDKPMIGVGVLISEDDRYIIKRAVDPDKNLWSIPGGIVKIGERISYARAQSNLNWR